jgi:hypothetical protein
MTDERVQELLAILKASNDQAIQDAARELGDNLVAVRSMLIEFADPEHLKYWHKESRQELFESLGLEDHNEW